jgi:hemerythrin-like domain-containing protein
METMIDDIDSTLYEKFQTVWDEIKTDSQESGETKIDTNSDERWGKIVDHLQKMSVSEG